MATLREVDKSAESIKIPSDFQQFSDVYTDFRFLVHEWIDDLKKNNYGIVM